MNKKAHTPTLLLFVATIILILLALFTFASFNDTFAEDSEGRSQILGNIIFYQDYMIKKAEGIVKKIALFEGPLTADGKKEMFKEIARKENPNIAELNEFFSKIENNDFVFKLENQEYFFEMKNISLQSSNGANSINRTFSFSITFDVNGNRLHPK